MSDTIAIVKPRHWVLLVLLGLFGACTYRFLGGLRTDVYHGQVVDAETGTPLSDAAVTVAWLRAGVGIDSHDLSLLNVQETVTDSSGRFSLKVTSGLDWNPLSTRVDDPMIVIYQPGYQPLSYGTEVRYGFKGDQLVAGLKAGITLKLRALEAAKESLRSYVSLGEVLLSASVPYNRIPNLMRAINLQRKIAGIDPYLLATEKGSAP